MKNVLRDFVPKKKINIFYFLCLIIFILLLSLVGTAFITKDNPIPAKIERENVNTTKNIVNDVTELNPIQTKGILVPHEIADIVNAVKENNHVSIGGGRNSMGGQTASTKAIQLDMREYNKILTLSTTTKEITVQSGIRWRDIQDYIDPYNLSVKIMQTYSNFTVGGSLSVNVHGRYVGLGPIILSVKSFRIVLADGSVVEATPSNNTDIFYSAIGGMGGIGVITDVTLELADNINVERTRVLVPTNEYAAYFKNQVKSNPDVLFHNGDMYPLDFEKVSAVSWTKTDKTPTTQDRLIPHIKDYWKERVAWVIMSEWPFGLWIREYILDPLVYRGYKPVHTRNYEASYDVAELEPKDRDGSTYVLQEYFVPVENFDIWVPKMKKVFIDNDVNIINVSIRHALPDLGAKLAWAKTESFAFVVYYKQGTDDKSKAKVGNWTREMIQEVLSVGGTYYLPYQLQATKEQLQQAYPHLNEYFIIKKEYDPTNKFTNSLWDKYYDPLTDGITTQKVTINKDSTYNRPFAITYASIPEWYIVYSADEFYRTLEKGLPSMIPFSLSNVEYWEQYNKVISLIGNDSTTKPVQDYMLVLKVIGVSFSLENTIRGLYENTLGKVSEYVAVNKQTPEDVFAYHVAKDYAIFIYDYPWYDFPYFSYLKQLWQIEASDDCCSLGQDLRRIERKMYLSTELLIKSGYASVIAYFTHQKFGVQDDIVCATVAYTKIIQDELLCAPHYQPFTRSLLKTLEKEKDNQYFVIKDIAGNNSIALTYREPLDQQSSYENITELFRYKEIESTDGKTLKYSYRVTSLVPVAYLPLLYETLTTRGIVIDHFYDY